MRGSHGECLSWLCQLVAVQCIVERECAIFRALCAFFAEILKLCDGFILIFIGSGCKSCGAYFFVAGNRVARASEFHVEFECNFSDKNILSLIKIFSFFRIHYLVFTKCLPHKTFILKNCKALSFVKQRILEKKII